jgi:hypothetical protein
MFVHLPLRRQLLDVTQYTLVDKYRRFGESCYLYLHERRTRYRHPRGEGSSSIMTMNEAYYTKVPYLFTSLPEGKYWKTVILIVTTARTSHITTMNMNSITGYLPATQEWQLFNDYGTQSIRRPRHEWEDNI